jgi:hypothetical protein
MNLIKVTPTITAGAYAANDAVGGKLEFNGVPSENGLLHSITLIDKANEKAAMVLVLYDDDFTADADNAAYSVEAGDIDNIVGVVEIAAADYITVGSIAVATVRGLSLPIKNNKDEGKTFAQLMTTGTPTYTSTTDLIIKAGILRDGGF